MQHDDIKMTFACICECEWPQLKETLVDIGLRQMIVSWSDAIERLEVSSYRWCSILGCRSTVVSQKKQFPCHFDRIMEYC